MFNSYGPTEATVVATVAKCGPTARHHRRADPNYSCTSATRRQSLVAGIEGELLIGGPGVARGYLKRDE